MATKNTKRHEKRMSLFVPLRVFCGYLTHQKASEHLDQPPSTAADESHCSWAFAPPGWESTGQCSQYGSLRLSLRLLVVSRPDGHKEHKKARKTDGPFRASSCFSWPPSRTHSAHRITKGEPVVAQARSYPAYNSDGIGPNRAVRKRFQ